MPPEGNVHVFFFGQGGVDQQLMNKTKHVSQLVLVTQALRSPIFFKENLHVNGIEFGELTRPLQLAAR